MGSLCSCINQLNIINESNSVIPENPKFTTILSKSCESILSSVKTKNKLLENEFLVKDDIDIDFSEMKDLSPFDENNPLKIAKTFDPMFPQEDERTWFLPHCSRENAEKLLKGRKDGTFLVRDSPKLKGKYILSLMIGSHIKHIVINKTEDGYCLYGDERHPTLMSLIMFYANPYENSTNISRTNLEFPVFK